MTNLPIQLFNYENNEVRSLKKDDGSIWFVAVDICKVLDLNNVTKAVSRLEKDEVTTIQVTDSLGRNQDTNIINESGLYSLILTSKKKEAKVFKKWVTSEVLPSIRKTGSYNSQEQPKIMSLEELALLQAQNVLNLRKDLNEVKTMVQDLVDEKQKNLEQLKIIEMPKVLPLQKSDRSKLVQLIRTYSRAKSIQIPDAWNLLYDEFKYTYHIDIKQCASNRKISNLDYVESIAKIPELYALAYELFVNEKKAGA